ncbi:MAG: ABC transporter ATP-binding protein [Betaproteobacteria bacterium]|nr:ABC transporter ATP-binding protein [Betaproteobacteria bacterium]
MLCLDCVSKSVPGGRRLMDSLSFQAGRGEFIAVMGESGVGKSTLLNLVAGLDRPDSGRILLDGTDVTALGEDEMTLLRREKIGFVFQAFHLLPYLSIAQNVALPLRLLGHSGAESLARAGEALAQVGIAPERASDSPAVLSGGEMQRVAIARAIVHRPALILADEPTGNLDPETAVRVLDVLEDCVRKAGITLLLVTHSQLAARRADRVMMLTGSGLVPA